MLNIILCWICWLFWAGLPTVTAYPVSSSIQTDSPYIHPSSKWERHWIQYMIGLLSVTVAAFTLVGCLCCRRPRRPKGFQDKAEKCKQEFKDGNNIGQDSTFEHSTEGLVLEVPRMLAVTDRVEFEPLPVEQIISEPKNVKPKPLPLSTSFFEECNYDSNALPEPCREWFEAEDLRVPREKLKYLREIGHGWFGKVVEGSADLEGSKRTSKNGGVVVRILTEEASTKEKAWFLGEAIPYLKLNHQNVLTLLGFCLETDPYLLLFESCPVGDLKGFLLSNRDNKSQEALNKESIPIRMALDIAAGLKHMHSHGFVHTDLSARNCLVASDLSAKLGDYGTGVEKYPEDYYVVGDRALPIRWSAPESIECTDTTIETREITSQANMWSFAIFLWEIVTWGNRPYNDKSDEQVIQMLLSLRTDLLPNGTQVLQTYLENCPPNVLHAIHSCLNINPQKRPNLDELKQIFINEHIEYLDFEQRWENLQTNAIKQTRSASLQDLRGSIDSDYWTTIVDDTPCQSSFRLGPSEPVKNVPNVKNVMVQHESSSETEEESWKGRIEQGVYTEKVKQKSKSVTDLMVLVHIDFDSDAELSMGAQISDKYTKKKLPATGSDSDLRHSVHTDEFDETLRKLRDPLPNNTCNKLKMVDNSEQPKLLTLTMDQGQTPILRLSLDNKEFIPETNTAPIANTSIEPHSDKHVLRLLSKGEPNLPLLRYVPDDSSSLETLKQVNESQCNNLSNYETNNNTCFSNNFSVNFQTDESNLIDVELWNHALDSALEKKVPGFLDEGDFNEYTESSSKHNTLLMSDIPQSPRKYSAYNVDDEFSNGEDVDIEQRCLPNEDEEERKQLSTPDDEQSSDSGFRDKESCEEEENICPSSVPTSSANDSTTAVLSYPKEEQLQVLFELDTILDAEYYATLDNSEKVSEELSLIKYTENDVFHTNQEKPDSIQTVDAIIEIKNIKDCVPTVTEIDTIKAMPIDKKEEHIENVINNKENVELENQNDRTFICQPKTFLENNMLVKTNNSGKNEVQNECLQHKCDRDNKNENVNKYENENINVHKNENNNVNKNENENENESVNKNESTESGHGNETEDEDSSTMSLRSDNSYASFVMEEEVVTAIRNELREKLPCAQMNVVEPLESHDEDNPSVSSDIDNKQWDDDDCEESSNQGSEGVGISIRYNVYGTPLSPIQEERESTFTSDSLMSDSRDLSIASKESAISDDVLLVDTRTNKMILLEGLGENLQDDDRDTTNEDLSEDENLDYSCSVIRSCDDKSRIVIMSGGAPLPSPEEEPKWQQLPSSFPLPLPLPLQDDLMSTSFATEHGWGSQDDAEEEDEEEEEEEEDEDNSSSSGEFVWKRYNVPHVEETQIRSTCSQMEDTVTDADIDNEMDAEEEEDEDNSSSSGEFVWKRYNVSHVDETQSRNTPNEVEGTTVDAEIEEEMDAEGQDEEEEEEEEEFTPSAWNATLAPHRSALRSPDKTLKAGDQKKSVWFKKQRYHCVYEYPKETLSTDAQGEATTTWEPTSYADWEEMMNEPRLDLYPLDYDDANHSGSEEFFVSSSNRPFQFQTRDSKYVSQFFPGASTSMNEERDEVDGDRSETNESRMELLNDYSRNQQHQLGELRHTRDRLKLNLSMNGAPFVSVKQVKDDAEQFNDEKERSQSSKNVDFTQDQCILPNSLNSNVLPTVPPKYTKLKENPDATFSKSSQCDTQEKVETSDKCSVLAHD